MSTTHYEVCKHFARRDSSKNSRGHNVYTGHENTEIYSYGSHFVMAYADDEAKVIIINGDRYSHSTTQHQSYLRGALQSHLPKNYSTITVPFSIAAHGRADIDIRTIRQIAIEPDKETAFCKTHDADFSRDTVRGGFTAWQELQNHRKFFDKNDDPCETHYFHQLGGSVFRARQNYKGPYKYFLSGFDETHNTRSDGYFVSMLPHPVKTVDEAFESLKPKEVRDAIAAGLDVKRQGDCFAIPVSSLNVRKTLKVKQRAHFVDIIRNRYVGTYPDGDYEDVVVGKELEIPSVGRSHSANQVGFDRFGRVFARGSLIHTPAWRNSEHKKIPLGKTWHRIVFNTAKGSWSLGGRVD